MNTPEIHTKRLKLLPQTIEEVRAMIEGMTPEEQRQLSPEWIALFLKATSPDHWVHGFTFVLRDNGMVVGKGGFKGPPSEDGIVEIAYGINTEHQGKGYATEAAEALTNFAFSTGKVHVVRAHTLPTGKASMRVLMKCGFEKVGEVTDPDDGLVWRWEKGNSTRLDQNEWMRQTMEESILRSLRYRISPDDLLDEEWLEFRARMQDGDELWYFRTPQETWTEFFPLCGMEGYALIRGDKVVADILKAMS